MTSSQKLIWGIGLGIGGYILFLVGVLLSFSLIGACIGIPMALVGLPLGIWGSVWMYQGKVQQAKEIIAAGVQQGIQQAAVTQAAVRPPASAQPPMPPPLPPQDSKCRCDFRPPRVKSSPDQILPVHRQTKIHELSFYILSK